MIAHSKLVATKVLQNDELMLFWFGKSTYLCIGKSELPAPTESPRS